jgi:hypothetical protein
LKEKTDRRGTQTKTSHYRGAEDSHSISKVAGGSVSDDIEFSAGLKEQNR